MKMAFEGCQQEFAWEMGLLSMCPLAQSQTRQYQLRINNYSTLRSLSFHMYLLRWDA